MLRSLKGALEKQPCGSCHCKFLKRTLNFISLWVELVDPLLCHANFSHRLKLWWEAHFQSICFFWSSLCSSVCDMLVHSNDFQVVCLQGHLFVVCIIFLIIVSVKLYWLVNWLNMHPSKFSFCFFKPHVVFLNYLPVACVHTCQIFLNV